MTFIIAVACKSSIWLCADRRLTRGRSVAADDATKVLVIEHKDGLALLGYSGLGKTQGGTEPSDWMKRVLRGRNWPIEASLGAIASAMAQHLPKYLSPRHLTDHNVVAATIISGKPALYLLQIGIRPGGAGYATNFARVQSTAAGILWVPFYVFAGSGATDQASNRRFRRETNRLFAARDRKRLSDHAVADRFAAFNFEISKKNRSVGPNCVVLWRLRQGGGGIQYYSGTRRTDGPIVAHIGNGTDLESLFKAITPVMFEFLKPGQPPSFDERALQRALDQFNALPTTPDETLK